MRVAIATAHAGLGLKELVHDRFSARQRVEDDDMNIKCMGGRVAGTAMARSLIDTFLATGFSGAKRHLRRLCKVVSLECRLPTNEMPQGDRK